MFAHYFLGNFEKQNNKHLKSNNTLGEKKTQTVVKDMIKSSYIYITKILYKPMRKNLTSGEHYANNTK